ncbi:hypothetical protein U9M48_013222 [Paspalum notatum var. saurae]|uniref:Uncharacterized protein n=1 Tax=Paspalum notatum var. saurae TaxID=547442 RepID=A0AAQ3SZZ5_PASNO
MMRIGTASSLHGANSFRRQPRPSSSPRVDNVGDSGHASNGMKRGQTDLVKWSDGQPRGRPTWQKVR